MLLASVEVDEVARLGLGRQRAILGHVRLEVARPAVCRVDRFPVFEVEVLVDEAAQLAAAQHLSVDRLKEVKSSEARN